MYSIIIFLGAALSLTNNIYSLYNSLESDFKTLTSKAEDSKASAQSTATTAAAAWYQSYLSKEKSLEASAITDTKLSSLIAHYASEIGTSGGVAADISSITSEAQSALNVVESAVHSAESKSHSSSSSSGANLLVPGAALGVIAVALL